MLLKLSICFFARNAKCDKERKHFLKEADLVKAQSPPIGSTITGQIDCSEKGNGKKTCAKYLTKGESLMYAYYEGGKLREKKFGGLPTEKGKQTKYVLARFL